MPALDLTTNIKAPIELCFDIARDADLHLRTMEHSDERVVAGVANGLIGLYETVTWQARHFGVVMKLTSEITHFNYPLSFVDEMIEGPFIAMKHTHRFEKKGENTLMTDEFYYKSPFGFLGRLANNLFLESYMNKLLAHRNMIIKKEAELAAISLLKY